jgi:hypothetical protein
MPRSRVVEGAVGHQRRQSPVLVRASPISKACSTAASSFPACGRECVTQRRDDGRYPVASDVAMLLTRARDEFAALGRGGGGQVVRS